MATNPMGPTFDGGEEVVGVNSDGQRYEVLFLPDVNNDDLQREGKPPNFYWVPRAVRIARRGEGGTGGQSGDYKFRLIQLTQQPADNVSIGINAARDTLGLDIVIHRFREHPQYMYCHCKLTVCRHNCNKYSYR